MAVKDCHALKLAGIGALMSIDNPEVLQKAVKSLFKTAGQSFEKPVVVEEETISKEESWQVFAKDCWILKNAVVPGGKVK